MSEARWEIQDGERVLGPYTDEDVFRAIAGTLPPTAPARLLGQEEWRPIGTVSPFAEVYMRRAVGAPTAAPAVSRALRVKKIDTLANMVAASKGEEEGEEASAVDAPRPRGRPRKAPADQAAA